MLLWVWVSFGPSISCEAFLLWKWSRKLSTSWQDAIANMTCLKNIETENAAENTNTISQDGGVLLRFMVLNISLYRIPQRSFFQVYGPATRNQDPCLLDIVLNRNAFFVVWQSTVKAWTNSNSGFNIASHFFLEQCRVQDRVYHMVSQHGALPIILDYCSYWLGVMGVRSPFIGCL